MPRSHRLDLPGVAQHVIQRGNDRRPCCFAPIDYIRYLQDLRAKMVAYPAGYAWSSHRRHAFGTPDLLICVDAPGPHA